ncbi:uncharacterized protein UTRI_06653_B [Ustilago trichophora]|uniref:Uncharacterized protein n=1 Tax=Ustilago trichophora TaxID=86804 RepID=A0A5C3ER58_9BASI|nr:uncharacterized protein UTRI_06653_B [Ustilago trichophora]
MSASQETDREPRAALALNDAAMDATPPVAASSTPRMSSGSSHMSAHNALPSYTEASTSSLAADTIPGPSSQASASRVIAPGSDSFFDIAPRSDSTSFQVGYLGLKGFQAWLKGDVLVKLDSETKSKGRYTRCVVQLQAKEQAPGFYSHIRLGAHDAGAASATLTPHDVVELFSHTLVLWDADKEPTSSNAVLPTMPSTMPFSFPLTADLPHCVHLRDSSLTYTITAQLFSQDVTKLPHAIKTVPVHLVRYTRPGLLNDIELAEIDGAALPNDVYTLQPHNWVKQLPTLVYAQINRTIFRRAEPIDIRVRIPPPDPTSVSEKGLKLRAVEADLVRIIHVKRSNVEEGDGEDTSTADDTATHPHVHEALLAHSGKLCRFHSKRPVLLRLTLHPPFDRANMPHPHPDHDALASGPVFGRGGGGGCESISQETLMHKVSFEVRIKVGIQGGRGERRDIICRRSVKILPGAAGALEDLNGNTSEQNSFSVLSEKERLKMSEKARMLADDNNAGASSSHDPSITNDLLDFGMDDEYDGYEDVGRSLNDLIDAAHESDVAVSSSQVSDHAERLEQLRQFLDVSDPSAHDDRPPPTLLESRNDLQVEVEVEGVGMAMPRLAYRHPADPFPDMGGVNDDSFLPPPPINATHHQPSEELSSYNMLSIASEEGSGLPSEADDPPPPLSPLMSRATTQGQAEQNTDASSGSQGLHRPGGLPQLDLSSTGLAQGDEFPLPPPHSPTRTYTVNLDLSAPSSSLASRYHDPGEAHPSYEAATSGSFVTLRERLHNEIRHNSGNAHHEPPPYADGASHADPVPSFDQAIQSRSSASRFNVPPSNTQSHPATQNMQQEREELPPPPAHEHSSLQSADHHPPAYGTSPHPPSYDA